MPPRGRPLRKDSFEHFYLTKVALGDCCGCAERVIDWRDIENASKLQKKHMGTLSEATPSTGNRLALFVKSLFVKSLFVKSLLIKSRVVKSAFAKAAHGKTAIARATKNILIKTHR